MKLGHHIIGWDLIVGVILQIHITSLEFIVTLFPSEVKLYGAKHVLRLNIFTELF